MIETLIKDMTISSRPEKNFLDANKVKCLISEQQIKSNLDFLEKFSSTYKSMSIDMINHYGVTSSLMHSKAAELQHMKGIYFNLKELLDNLKLVKTENEALQGYIKQVKTDMQSYNLIRIKIEYSSKEFHILKNILSALSDEFETKISKIFSSYSKKEEADEISFLLKNAVEKLNKRDEDFSIPFESLLKYLDDLSNTFNNILIKKDINKDSKFNYEDSIYSREKEIKQMQTEELPLFKQMIKQNTQLLENANTLLEHCLKLQSTLTNYCKVNSVLTQERLNKMYF
jgi:hypothetical protein